MQPKTPVTCSLCHRQLARSRCVPVQILRPAMVEHLRLSHPDWVPEGFICHDDLSNQRAAHLQKMLQSGKETIADIEADVVRTMKTEELISRNIREGDGLDSPTFGQRMADNVAQFGGSWRFLIAFAVLLSLWIAINVFIAIRMHDHAFDPYPFILLNLILSCLASVQAPIIMMSQNRTEARDRRRAEDDYKVNLKAELEIRDLRDKFDHLLDHQWQYLMEIQQIQIELMEELASRPKK